MMYSRCPRCEQKFTDHPLVLKCPDCAVETDLYAPADDGPPSGSIDIFTMRRPDSIQTRWWVNRTFIQCATELARGGEISLVCATKKDADDITADLKEIFPKLSVKTSVVGDCMRGLHLRPKFVLIDDLEDTPGIDEEWKARAKEWYYKDFVAAIRPPEGK